MSAAEHYYVDTSAYLCVLLGEEGWEALVGELRGARVVSSSLLVLETTRTLVRLSRIGVLAADRLQLALERVETDLTGFVLRDLTLDLCRGLTMPVVTTPRSLDLAHLRTALWFHERDPLTRFVSLDGPQNLAARELGLRV
ncbi:PIN domain-containing protein [Planctomycetota bacterium]